MRRPYIASQGLEVAVGAAAVLVGFVLLYDAWDGRGGRKPWFLGPILPW